MTHEFIEFITEKRQTGLSFKRISELLFEEFGYRTSRQSVCKCYNQSLQAKHKIKDIENKEMTEIIK